MRNHSLASFHTSVCNGLPVQLPVATTTHCAPRGPVFLAKVSLLIGCIWTKKHSEGTWHDHLLPSVPPKEAQEEGRGWRSPVFSPCLGPHSAWKCKARPQHCQVWGEVEVVDGSCSTRGRLWGMEGWKAFKEPLEVQGVALITRKLWQADPCDNRETTEQMVGCGPGRGIQRGRQDRAEEGWEDPSEGRPEGNAVPLPVRPRSDEGRDAAALTRPLLGCRASPRGPSQPEAGL